MKPAAIPIKDRPPFRFEAGHHSKAGQFSALKITSWVGNFGINHLAMNGDILMPAKRRLTMRQLRQMLRLAGSGTSSREIAVVLGIARSTVQDNLQRAAAVGLSWPLPDELTDDALEHKLFSRNGVKQGTRRRTEPNWADLAVELKKPGVTLLILWRSIVGRIPTVTAIVVFVNF
ncbi:hypothetical protein [Mesorhizobium sp.]|uniref:hypothetical protein n=1 Tax=Mesorhizobium sp. TaxID=1871066 RepID=UPI00257A7E1F|nr:hypothetical protein [Mesorhizobium sp.]